MKSLTEITRMLTNNNQKFVDEITEMDDDFYSFYQKHEERFNDDLDLYLDDDDGHDYVTESIFSEWLHFNFSAVVDWKEYIDEILRQLDDVNKNLCYPLDIDKIEIDSEEDTLKALAMINAHFSARGYKLVGLESHSDCYNLFITPDFDGIACSRTIERASY